MFSLHAIVATGVVFEVLLPATQDAFVLVVIVIVILFTAVDGDRDHDLTAVFFDPSCEM